MSTRKIWKEIMCTNSGNNRSHIVIHVPFMNSELHGLEKGDANKLV